MRQLLGAQGVSLRVCGAADPSQGPWEPGALRAALSLGGQATAGDGRPMLNEIEDVVGARMIYELTDMPLHELYIDRLIHALKHC